MISGIGNQGTMNNMSNMSVQRGPSPEEKFNELDADGDGSVSKAELETLTTEISERSGQSVTAADMLSEYDSDSSGGLSQSEMDSMAQAVMEQFGPSQAGSGGGNADFQQAMSSYSSNMGSSDISGMLSQLGSKPAPPSFNQVDEDADGAVSQSELDTLIEEMSEVSGTDLDAEELLTEFDEDEDGTLSGNEMDSLMADLHETLGPPPPPQGGGQMETMSDVFSSYLADADSDTIAGLTEVITNYFASDSSDSGVDVSV